ncbi:MAG: aldo/keto reductase [Phycisphaerae bacterium]|nr:aldo/keto reductase [Phycisphaerae bacterium]
MSGGMKRRDFLRQIGGGAATLGLGVLSARAGEVVAGQVASAPAGLGGLTIKDLPRRMLGRTGVEVPPLSIGLAPMGHAFFTSERYEPVANAAIDAGLTYLDIAPMYDVSEERLGPVMAKRRKEVFLVGKTHATTRDGALQMIEQSLRKMRTDHLDVCHLHNVGRFKTEQVLGKGGMLDGLQAAKDRGLIRFIGASGHQNGNQFLPVLETGQIDVLMVAMNFVDRYIYNFEERVLPTARKHQMGIVAMKVLGGVTGGWGGYRKANPGQLIGKHHSLAIRYAMEIPGVDTLVVGIKSVEELRLAVRAVRDYKPLTEEEKTMLSKEGRALAAKWGNHFGPV